MRKWPRFNSKSRVRADFAPHAAPGLGSHPAQTPRVLVALPNAIFSAPDATEATDVVPSRSNSKTPVHIRTHESLKLALRGNNPA